MAGIDWSKALDLAAAARNLRVEMGPNDWHQDPWGWPELSYLVKKEPALVYDNCVGKGAMGVASIDVPKENWGTRPAVLLDITDRLTYQALVDRNSLDLIGDLSPNTFGWRLPAVSPRRATFSRNDKQWDGYTSHLQMLASLFTVALRTDLVSFFASLPVDSVQEMIQDRTAKGAVTSRLCSFLEGFDEKPGHSGLPQRSFASAAIANMYLMPADDVLTHHAQAVPVLFRSKVKRHSWARWMDDMWLFGNDAAGARRAQMDLQAQVQAIGLNLNYSKTEVLEGDQVAEQALLIEHSAVDNAIHSKKNFVPLEQLVDRLLSEREKASRTSIRFVVKRMRDHRHPYKAQEIALLAGRMPHVADTWSRFMKETFKHGSLQDWFLDYVASGWATHEWSIAQFGRMFPSAKRPRKATREYFCDAVRDANTSVSLLAFAAERTCAWDAAAGRAACRDAFARASTPHARRILALAGLGVGETRPTVRKWLKADKENFVTLQLLESRGFAPVKVDPYFAT